MKSTKVLTSHHREGAVDSTEVPLLNKENPHQKLTVGNNVKVVWGDKT